MKLDELLVNIRACRACEAELPFEPRPILSVSDSARLLIVGQAPGVRVHDSGVAWKPSSSMMIQ